MKLALIGAGVIGRRHLAAIDDAGVAEVSAIADPTPAAMALAEARGIHCYPDADALFTAHAPDGVIVATPTALHLAPAIRALEARAHVLVEKPITATPDQARQLIAVAAEQDRQLLVGHHRRYYPQVGLARQIIQGGLLGQLIGVSGQWTLRKPDHYYDADWRKRWEAGPLVTNLIHEIDLLRYIAGEIASVSADVSHEAWHFDKEDAASISLRFDSGALGSMLISDQGFSPWAWELASGENVDFPASGCNVIRFVGREGSLEFPNLRLWRHSDEVFDLPAVLAEGQGGIERLAASLKDSVAARDWHQTLTARSVSLDYGDAYVAQIRHFVDVISGQAAPIITGADGLQNLEVVAAVSAAAADGRRVVVGRDDR